jgi:UDP-glucose 4-epimerase
MISNDITFAPKRAGEPPVISPDVSKFRHNLNWIPRVPVADGVSTLLSFSGLDNPQPRQT